MNLSRATEAVLEGVERPELDVSEALGLAVEVRDDLDGVELKPHVAGAGASISQAVDEVGGKDGQSSRRRSCGSRSRRRQRRGCRGRRCKEGRWAGGARRGEVRLGGGGERRDVRGGERDEVSPIHSCGAGRSQSRTGKRETGRQGEAGREERERERTEVASVGARHEVAVARVVTIFPSDG